MQQCNLRCGAPGDIYLLGLRFFFFSPAGFDCRAFYVTFESLQCNKMGLFHDFCYDICLTFHDISCEMGLLHSLFYTVIIGCVYGLLFVRINTFFVTLEFSKD